VFLPEVTEQALHVLEAAHKLLLFRLPLFLFSLQIGARRCQFQTFWLFLRELHRKLAQTYWFVIRVYDVDKVGIRKRFLIAAIRRVLDRLLVSGL